MTIIAKYSIIFAVGCIWLCGLTPSAFAWIGDTIPETRNLFGSPAQVVGINPAIQKVIGDKYRYNIGEISKYNSEQFQIFMYFLKSVGSSEDLKSRVEIYSKPNGAPFSKGEVAGIVSITIDRLGNRSIQRNQGPGSYRIPRERQVLQEFKYKV